TATLSELHAADPDGYVFETHYPAVGHDDLPLLDAPSVFAFLLSHTVPARPERVLGVLYEDRVKSHYWAALARAGAADGRPALLRASLDTAANAVTIDGAA